MTLSFSIIQKEPVQIIGLYGQLIEKSAASELVQYLDDAFDSGSARIVLDLSELKYMNSSGLNLLISIMTKARKAEGDVVLACISDKIRELLLITKLNTVFTCTETIDEAVSSLSNTQ